MEEAKLQVENYSDEEGIEWRYIQYQLLFIYVTF